MSAPIHLATHDDIPRIEAALQRAARIAVDTEFHAERRYVPELYLVQFHVEGTGSDPGETWILDPLRSDLLARLGPALLSVTWVVHAGEQDLRVLSMALGALPEEILDTQLAAGLVSNHWPAPYQGLVQQHLDTHLDKGETLSDWSRRPLTESQLTYAALDVQHVLPLWDRLDEKLAARGRAEIARQACAHARRRSLDGPDEGEAFREIGAAHTLPPPALLVLQELAAWRLQRAMATNQPVRSVLSDGILMDLSRRRPITPESLKTNRRLPKSISRDAPALVERIGRAVARPAEAVPKVVRRRTPQWRCASFLQLWAECFGEAEGFAASLVLPRRLVESIVADPCADRSALADRLGWRDPLCGDAVAGALRGEVGDRGGGWRRARREKRRLIARAPKKYHRRKRERTPTNGLGEIFSPPTLANHRAPG